MGESSDTGIETEAGPSSPEPTAAPIARTDDDRAVQRILQVKGRRYSIRLEPIFWRVLEELAGIEGIRLNALVRRIADFEASNPSGNLTSRLRVFCTRELRQKLLGAMLPATHRSIFSLAEVSPAPCLVISDRQEILSANVPFGTWFGAEGRSIVGHPVARHFRFRSTPAYDEVWAEFGEGRVLPHPARIISIVPGRVRATNVILQPIPFEAQAGFVCFVWLRV